MKDIKIAQDATKASFVQGQTIMQELDAKRLAADERTHIVGRVLENVDNRIAEQHIAIEDNMKRMAEWVQAERGRLEMDYRPRSTSGAWNNIFGKLRPMGPMQVEAFIREARG